MELERENRKGRGRGELREGQRGWGGEVQGIVSVSYGSYNKVPQTGNSNNRNTQQISQLWWLEV